MATIITPLILCFVYIPCCTSVRLREVDEVKKDEYDEEYKEDEEDEEDDTSYRMDC
jgi:hypothetical protein